MLYLRTALRDRAGGRVAQHVNGPRYGFAIRSNSSLESVAPSTALPPDLLAVLPRPPQSFSKRALKARPPIKTEGWLKAFSAAQQQDSRLKAMGGEILQTLNQSNLLADQDRATIKACSQYITQGGKTEDIRFAAQHVKALIEEKQSMHRKIVEQKIENARLAEEARLNKKRKSLERRAARLQQQKVEVQKDQEKQIELLRKDLAKPEADQVALKARIEVLQQGLKAAPPARAAALEGSAQTKESEAASRMIAAGDAANTTAKGAVQSSAKIVSSSQQGRASDSSRKPDPLQAGASTFTGNPRETASLGWKLVESDAAGSSELSPPVPSAGEVSPIGKSPVIAAELPKTVNRNDVKQAKPDGPRGTELDQPVHAEQVQTTPKAILKGPADFKSAKPLSDLKAAASATHGSQLEDVQSAPPTGTAVDKTPRLPAQFQERAAPNTKASKIRPKIVVTAERSARRDEGNVTAHSVAASPQVDKVAFENGVSDKAIPAAAAVSSGATSAEAALVEASLTVGTSAFAEDTAAVPSRSAAEIESATDDLIMRMGSEEALAHHLRLRRRMKTNEAEWDIASRAALLEGQVKQHQVSYNREAMKSVEEERQAAFLLRAKERQAMRAKARAAQLAKARPASLASLATATNGQEEAVSSQQDSASATAVLDATHPVEELAEPSVQNMPAEPVELRAVTSIPAAVKEASTSESKRVPLSSRFKIWLGSQQDRWKRVLATVIGWLPSRHRREAVIPPHRTKLTQKWKEDIQHRMAAWEKSIAKRTPIQIPELSPSSTPRLVPYHAAEFASELSIFIEEAVADEPTQTPSIEAQIRGTKSSFRGRLLPSWSPQDQELATFFHVRSEMTAVGFDVNVVNKDQAEYAFNFVRKLLHDPACLSVFTDGSYHPEEGDAGAGLTVLGQHPVVKAVPLSSNVTISVEAELSAILCGIYALRESLRQGRHDGRLYESVGLFSDCLVALEGIAGHPIGYSDRSSRLTVICRREILTLAREAGVHVFFAWAPKVKSAGVQEAHRAADQGRQQAAAIRKSGPSSATKRK